MTNVSVLVAIRNRSRFMLECKAHDVFPRCVKSLRKCANAGIQMEIIVADHGSTDYPLADWFDHECGPVPHKIITMTGEFSRGKCVNAAARAASTNVFAIIQPDMLVPLETFYAGMRSSFNGRALFPKYRWQHTEDWSKTSPGCGTGNCVLAKDLFWKAGGWPEFDWMKCPSGPGTDDTTFAHNVEKHAKLDRDEIEGLVHIWHPRDW